jgi:hypothetical protein
MKLTLKTVNINKAMSDETLCFDATVYADGKRAGIVCNRGCGGPNEYHWADRDLGAEIEAWAEKEVIVTEDPTDPEKMMFIDFEKLDWKIDEVLDAYLDNQWLKRQCRGKVLFRLKGDDDSAWRTLKLRGSDGYTPQAKQWLEARYKDELGEIANERFV